jgi:uncharacterized membrane protein
VTRERGKAPPPPEVPSAVGEHIETIAELEQQWLRERKVGEHLGDALASALGSLEALVVHAIWFVAWIAVNLGAIPGVAPFDPFPFGLLTLVVSLEAIFLSLFLLVSQKRLTHQTEKRAHFDMQINMLAETEVTAILVLVRKLCHKLGVEELNEAELRDLARPTDLKKLFQAVEKKIPDATTGPH